MHRVAVSWSGGKESSLSCYKALQQGYDVVYLLNMISPEGGRSRGHGLRGEILQAQSEAIGIPIIQRMATWETYEEEFGRAIDELRGEGVRGIIFGDIDLEEHREWNIRICREHGVRAISPLWGMDPRGIMEEFLGAGFKAMIINVKAEIFGKEWLGRVIDGKLLGELLRLAPVKGFHICGENGEYHTFVFDGPLFKRCIRILSQEKVLRDGRWLLDIRRYEFGVESEGETDPYGWG